MGLQLRSEYFDVFDKLVAEKISQSNFLQIASIGDRFSLQLEVYLDKIHKKANKTCNCDKDSKSDSSEDEDSDEEEQSGEEGSENESSDEDTFNSPEVSSEDE